MTRTGFWLFLITALVFTACKEDKGNGNLSIQFKATYQDQPLVMFANAYDYPDGTFKAHLLNFFLSDISLIKDNDQTVKLSDIELIEFKDEVDLISAQTGVTTAAYTIESGNYKGIQFGLGVSPTLNATDPAAYTPPHPLTENYWSWARGYVFYKFEGLLDTNNDDEYEQGLTYHVGHDDLYTTLSFDKAIKINKDGSETIVFTVDLDKMLRSPDGTRIDMIANPIDHTTNEAVYTQIATNFKNAFTLD